MSDHYKIWSISPIRVNKLSIYYQNIQDINTKLDMFTRNVSLCNYDSIKLTETWLSNSVVDAKLGLSSTHYFRCDRYSTRDVITRDGIVLIVIRNWFSYRWFSIYDNLIEQLFIKINDESSSLIIGAVYVPPAFDINVYDTHFNNIDV